MIKRELNKENFKEIFQWLENSETKEQNKERYNVRITVGNRLYSLKLQMDEQNSIYLLNAEEIISENDKKTLYPILKHTKLRALIEAFIFIALEEKAG